MDENEYYAYGFAAVNAQEKRCAEERLEMVYLQHSWLKRRQCSSSPGGFHL